jgi:hypothetical protein
MSTLNALLSFTASMYSRKWLFFVSHDCFEPVQVLYRIWQLRNKLPRLPVADDDF